MPVFISMNISNHAAMLAQDRLETIKCKGLNDCSLEADAKINA